MIVVIADDITGAAELAGIGLRFGMRVVLSDNVNISGKPDLLVIYTNTRSLTKEDAVSEMQALMRKVKHIQPTLFYKKTDSVLRGHVLAEMETQMKELGFDKALLVPVNPLLGRTIKDENYYLNGKHIHLSGFSSDPEFPIRSSRIKDMLGDESVTVTSSLEQLGRGITVGEAQSMNDLQKWTSYQHQLVLLAGAASFFSVLLKSRLVEKANRTKAKLSNPVLLVSGTSYRNSINQRKKYDHLVSYMPRSFFSGLNAEEKETEEWASQIVDKLSKHGKAIIAIGNNGDETADPAHLRHSLSEVVNHVLKKTHVNELLIEGGSTTFAIIQKLQFSSFVPTEELQQGVVRMKVEGKEGLHLTIKPGSYDWPQEWDFN